MRRTSELSVITACLSLETRWKQGQRPNSLQGRAYVTKECYIKAVASGLLSLPFQVWSLSSMRKLGQVSQLPCVPAL